MLEEENYTGFQNIESVGIELESGYCETCVQPIFNKYGSAVHLVQGSDCTVQVHNISCPHDSYQVSGAELRAWVRVENLEVLFSFVRELFESGGFKQNSSCGNHVHVKFKDENMIPFSFQTRESWNFFAARYSENFSESRKYLSRLSGKWCNRKWPGFLTCGSKDYMYTISRPVTHAIEFRVLPYFSSADESIKSYLWLLRLVDSMVKKFGI